MAGTSQMAEGLSWLKSLGVSLETMGSCWRMLRRVTWSCFRFRQISGTTMNIGWEKSLRRRKIRRLFQLSQIRDDTVLNEGRNSRARDEGLGIKDDGVWCWIASEGPGNLLGSLPVAIILMDFSHNNASGD